ncbi:PIN domain-containing protein [Dyadobacter sp. NIV53]|uniref:PIN domain-containing protein n=1 Tax=Dyadobacter sp. NIV53 TaxID=2861765 RepID=UPI001C886A6A|nr:PIN domain-containing protein [Dyadobacter sp. NIV53]
MYTQTIIPDSPSVTIQLPDSYVGQEVRLIAIVEKKELSLRISVIKWKRLEKNIQFIHVSIYQIFLLIVMMQMILVNSFIDSNIILYLLDKDNSKKEIAEKIMAGSPFLNAQVLVEVGNVCKRKFSYSKIDVLNIWSDLINDSIFVNIEETTMKYAIELIKRYDFQLFDSIIVASALESNCALLFSEDMQHGMVVEERLTIINPFK